MKGSIPIVALATGCEFKKVEFECGARKVSDQVTACLIGKFRKGRVVLGVLFENGEKKAVTVWFSSTPYAPHEIPLVHVDVANLFANLKEGGAGCNPVHFVEVIVTEALLPLTVLDIGHDERAEDWHDSRKSFRVSITVPRMRCHLEIMDAYVPVRRMKGFLEFEPEEFDAR